jgi:hypothetical protein
LGTLTAIYIRASDPTKADALLAEYPDAFTEPNTRYYAVEDPPCGWNPPEADLRDLSARLETDVLWLTFQSLVDAFEYHHWDAGQHLRTLVFGCHGEERKWERSEGQAEPWERDAIFDREGLAFWLEGASGDEKREYERIWRDAVLSPGQSLPSLDAREVARKVAEYYRLPGWCLDDDHEN